MGVYFDSILSKRGLTEAPIPLWKLGITDDEYNGLKDELGKVDPKNYGRYGKELALFYAECWRREYNGGCPSKEYVAQMAGIDIENAENAFLFAKNALKSLHIPIIHQATNQYFRTLLLQGGLPMFYVQQNEGFNRFRDFLKSLLKRLCSSKVLLNS